MFSIPDERTHLPRHTRAGPAPRAWLLNLDTPSTLIPLWSAPSCRTCGGPTTGARLVIWWRARPRCADCAPLGGLVGEVRESREGAASVVWSRDLAEARREAA